MSRSSGFQLDFERPIVELEKKIEELDSQSEIDGLDLQQEVERFRARAEKLREEIYSNLNAWQRVQISRHPDRPYALDYVERMLSDFTELHGDRLFGDDGAVIGGPARLDGESLMVIGIQSGRSIQRLQGLLIEFPASGLGLIRNILEPFELFQPRVHLLLGDSLYFYSGCPFRRGSRLRSLARSQIGQYQNMGRGNRASEQTK